VRALHKVRKRRYVRSVLEPDLHRLPGDLARQGAETVLK
jgi:hypothetical protein